MSFLPAPPAGRAHTLPSPYPPFRLTDVSTRPRRCGVCLRGLAVRARTWGPLPSTLLFFSEKTGPPSRAGAGRPRSCWQALRPCLLGEQLSCPGAHVPRDQLRGRAGPEMGPSAAAAAGASSTAGARQGPSLGTSRGPSPRRSLLSGQSYSRCVLRIPAGERPTPTPQQRTAEQWYPHLGCDPEQQPGRRHSKHAAAGGQGPTLLPSTNSPERLPGPGRGHWILSNKQKKRSSLLSRSSHFSAVFRQTRVKCQKGTGAPRGERQGEGQEAWGKGRGGQSSILG